jgi:glycine oxidase
MPEIIIIGGGAIGMLTARELHRAGADSLLLDRGPLGGESSWAGGGIISPLYPWRYDDSVNRLAELSKCLYPDIVGQLHDESGVDCELINSGLLVTDTDETEQALEWARDWSIEMQLIDNAGEIHKIEPATSSELDAGLWMPDIMQIIRGVITSTETLYADKVIVTSGAWTAGLITAVQAPAVEPVKGQMIMFRGETGLIRRMVLSLDHYIIPRRDGRVLAGSTLERTGFDKSTTDNAKVELKNAAVQIIPALDGCAIERHWAGLRPGTANGIPYICEHPEISGLFINAGHFRNGIVLGAASSRLMAELVIGKATSLDPSPYSMDALH